MSSAVKANRLWRSHVGRQNKEFMHGSLITTSLNFYRLVFSKLLVPNKISFRCLHIYTFFKIMFIFYLFFVVKFIKAYSREKSGEQKKE